MLGNADRQLDSQPSALGQQQHVKALVADEQLPPQVVTEPCNLPPFHLFQPLVTRQPPAPTLRPPESFHFHDLFHRALETNDAGIFRERMANWLAQSGPNHRWLEQHPKTNGPHTGRHGQANRRQSKTGRHWPSFTHSSRSITRRLIQRRSDE